MVSGEVRLKVMKVSDEVTQWCEVRDKELEGGNVRAWTSKSRASWRKRQCRRSCSAHAGQGP